MNIPKTKTISSRKKNLYDKLRKEILNIRRRTLRLRKEAEESQFKKLERLPSLVLPRVPPTSNRLSKLKRWQIKYREYIKAMRESINVIKDVKRNYLEAFRVAIEKYYGWSFDRLGNVMDKGPFDEKERRILNLYYRYRNMSYQQFQHMYHMGYIIQFRFVYHEIIHEESKDLSFIDEAIELSKEYKERFISKKKFDKSKANRKESNKSEKPYNKPYKE